MTPAAVAVTGLGLYTPAGAGVSESWAAVKAGSATARTDPSLRGLPVDFSCRVPVEPIELLGPRATRRMDRFAQFALVAAREAVVDAGLDPDTWNGPRVAVVLGSADGGPATVEREHRILRESGPAEVSPLLLPRQLPNMSAAVVAIDMAVHGPSMVIATACASGSTAIGIARDLLRLGRCDIALAGGSDAMITPLVMAGFANMGALSRRSQDPVGASRPFDKQRDGFVAAEGAAVLVLERPEDARARGARVHGHVAGFAATSDAHHVTAPRPDGRGWQQAIDAALADADVSTEDVDHVNAHGTSTRLNDQVESQLLLRMFGDHTPIASTKGVTGHLLGAAGAAEAIFGLLAAQENIVPPTANLEEVDPAIGINVSNTARRDEISVVVSTSFGFGGQNAVLVLTDASEKRSEP